MSILGRCHGGRKTGFISDKSSHFGRLMYILRVDTNFSMRERVRSTSDPSTSYKPCHPETMPGREGLGTRQNPQRRLSCGGQGKGVEVPMGHLVALLTVKRFGP